MWSSQQLAPRPKKKRPRIWARKRTQFGATNLAILDSRSMRNRAAAAALHRAAWNQMASQTHGRGTGV